MGLREQLRGRLLDWAMRQMNELRPAGWSHAEIVEIVAAVALMRYTTTLASALDVPLEKAMEGIGVSCGVPLERRDA